MSLRLTVLGASASWSERPGCPSSCYLLELGGEAILLDLGQGALGSLIPLRDPSTLTAVVISHMHADHHVDLIPLRHLLRFHYAEPRSVSLYLPPGLRERYDAFTGEPGFLSSMPGPVISEGHHAIGPYDVEARRVTHAENSFGFRVSAASEPAGPGLVYSGDCGRADDLLALMQAGDTALIEAFWSTRQPDPGANHLTAAEAADVARRGGADHLILTHILESHDPHAALRTAEGVFPGRVRLAEPGMVVEIGPAR